MNELIKKSPTGKGTIKEDVYSCIIVKEKNPIVKLCSGFPYTWGLILGFTLAAVSPAVVVPSLLSLQDMGYGVNEGIPSVVIAAASIDDILAICCFSVALGKSPRWLLWLPYLQHSVKRNQY